MGPVGFLSIGPMNMGTETLAVGVQRRATSLWFMRRPCLAPQCSCSVA